MEGSQDNASNCDPGFAELNRLPSHPNAVLDEYSFIADIGPPLGTSPTLSSGMVSIHSPSTEDLLTTKPYLSSSSSPSSASSTSTSDSNASSPKNPKTHTITLIPPDDASHSSRSSSSDGGVSSLGVFSPKEKTPQDTEAEDNKYWAEMHEKRTYTLLNIAEVYGKGQAIVTVVIVFLSILVYGVSRINFIRDNPTERDYFNTRDFTSLVVILFVLALGTFSAVLFYLIYGATSFFHARFYIPVGIAICIFIALPMALQAADFPYWYYHIDTLTLAAIYSSLSFAVGYFGNGSSNLKKRLKEGALILLTELFVTVTTLIYAMFLMWYYAEFNNVGKVFWRALFHPLFSEIVILVPVRFLVHHHISSSATKNVMYCLAIVHSQSHAVIMGRLMMPAIDELGMFTFCVFLVNIMKICVRSFSRYRDQLAYKILRGFVSESKMGFVDNAKNLTQAVEIQMDIMSEVAGTVLAAVTLIMLNDQRGVFMFPFPMEGITTARAVICVVIQLAIGAIFDYAALYIAEKKNKVPILDSWKMMWINRHTFFGFFAYGLFTMGLIGSMWMGFMVPRITHCSSQNVCSCSWMPSVGGCENFIATL